MGQSSPHYDHHIDSYPEFQPIKFSGLEWMDKEEIAIERNMHITQYSIICLITNFEKIGYIRHQDTCS